MKENLLILISGNGLQILDKAGIDDGDTLIRKIDEKDLSRFGLIKSIIKSGDYKRVIFGTQDISFQRFTFFISLFLFLTGKFSGFIADENGMTKKFSMLRFVFLEIPMFIAEIIASGIVALFFHIRFPLKLRQIRKKK